MDLPVPVADVVESTVSNTAENTVGDTAEDTVGDTAEDTLDDKVKDTVGDIAEDTVNDTVGSKDTLGKVVLADEVTVWSVKGEIIILPY